MIHSDEIQKLFREKQFIAENEIVISSGDLVLAENVLTRERRLLDSNIVQSYLAQVILASQNQLHSY